MYACLIDALRRAARCRALSTRRANCFAGRGATAVSHSATSRFSAAASASFARRDALGQRGEGDRGYRAAVGSQDRHRDAAHALDDQVEDHRVAPLARLLDVVFQHASRDPRIALERAATIGINASISRSGIHANSARLPAPTPSGRRLPICEVVRADRYVALLQRDADRLRAARHRKHRRVLEFMRQAQQACADDRPRIEARLRRGPEHEHLGAERVVLGRGTRG
jgi:hypothetical protein